MCSSFSHQSWQFLSDHPTFPQTRNGLFIFLPFFFPFYFFPFKCSQSCWCTLAESLKLMPVFLLNMSPDVCPPCCFHTAGCLQCSLWEQCRGWKWHTSLASSRIHSYSHQTHECCNFNDCFCSWLKRNQAQGCPSWEEALLMPPWERHFGSFPDFREQANAKCLQTYQDHGSRKDELPVTTRGGQQSVDWPYKLFPPFLQPHWARCSRGPCMSLILSHPSLPCM